MATNRASTVHDIQVNAAAVVLGEALHYSRQQAYGLPFENWHSASATWKHACIERAAYALETLKPIVKRPHLAMVKAPAPSLANSGDDRGEGEKPCGPSGGETSGTSSTPTYTPRVGLGIAVGRGDGETSADSDDEPFCPYCSCTIDPQFMEHMPYCSALCAVSAETEQ